MNKSFITIPKTFQRRKRSCNYSSRLCLKDPVPPVSYSPDFSELFYRKVRSLRKLFGIKQDLKTPIPTNIAPSPINSPKNEKRILPPTIQFSRRRDEKSPETYKNLVSKYYAGRINNNSLINARKRVRINISSNSNRNNVSVNLKPLPKILNSKSGLLLADDSLTGW